MLGHMTLRCGPTVDPKKSSDGVAAFGSLRGSGVSKLTEQQSAAGGPLPIIQFSKSCPLFVLLTTPERLQMMKPTAREPGREEEEEDKPPV